MDLPDFSRELAPEASAKSSEYMAEQLNDYTTANVIVETSKFPFLNSELSDSFTFWSVVFTISTLVYLNASRIVRAPLTFYIGSVVAGTFASLIIIAYALQKLLPRRALSFPIYLGGWPLSAYIYYKAWQNFGLLVMNYRVYLIGYMIVVALLSIAVCYRFGPPNHPRTLNLIKWSLQLFCLTLIYVAVSSNNIAAAAVIILLLVWPLYDSVGVTVSVVVNNARHFIYGPTPRRLLTEEEYQTEALAYTKKELSKLRDSMLDSPSSYTWRAVSRLKNPSRMASFVHGIEDHVSTDEINAFTRDIWVDGDESDNDALSDDNDDDGNDDRGQRRDDRGQNVADASPISELSKQSQSVCLSMLSPINAHILNGCFEQTGTEDLEDVHPIDLTNQPNANRSKGPRTPTANRSMLTSIFREFNSPLSLGKQS